MHNSLVKMKDGARYCGPMWEFKPTEGYMTIPSETDERLYFRDMESAVEKGQRVGIIRDAEGNALGPEVVDLDLLAEARRQGWDGT